MFRGMGTGTAFNVGRSRDCAADQAADQEPATGVLARMIGVSWSLPLEPLCLAIQICQDTQQGSRNVEPQFDGTAT